MIKKKKTNNFIHHTIISFFCIDFHSTKSIILKRVQLKIHKANLLPEASEPNEQLPFSVV